ncbi:MAG: L-serine ammonia-lyase, iron-sulfur-dependent, subunit alpha [Methanoregula sp.]|jgi:L-cysteine desulfidase
MNVKTFLRQNVIPVTGCSEPAAVAYATSIACQASGGCLPPDFVGFNPSPRLSEIKKITVLTDRNVFKNTFSAVIPGTDGQKGPAVAAAAGIFLNPLNGLDVFSGMTPEIRAKSRILALSDKISCGIHPFSAEEASPDIRVEVISGDDTKKKTVSVRISGRHDCIRTITIDGYEVYSNTLVRSLVSGESPPATIIGMIRIAEIADPKDIDEVYNGVLMNLALAEHGKYHVYGLGVGRNLHRIIANQKGQLSLVDKVRIAAAIAADARMGGAPYPVMSTSGSGNQGITALVPIGIIGRECKFSQDDIGRAALLSHMVTWHADRYLGHLSALCGCSIKAGIGAAAGIAYLTGGGTDEITTAINLMVANITGTICDGAKPGCALKIATAVGMAAESAFLAVDGMKIPEGNGIVRNSATDTFESIGKISQAMGPVDAAIVDLLAGFGEKVKG